MNTSSPATRDFFDRYATSRTTYDIDAIAAQYPDTFMSAGPNGARLAQQTAIVAGFPKGQAFLTSLGHESTAVVSLDETTIDDRYRLVRAVFVWRFRRPAMPAREATVESTFVLYSNDDVTRIVFQHEHEDFQQVLRASGVLPA